MTTEYLTTEEVATLLRTSPETVRYWRHIGKGPRSFKVGRRVLYAVGDVETFVAASMAQGMAVRPDPTPRVAAKESTPLAPNVRMWADVPEAERATDDDLLLAWAGMSDHYRDLERARLANPGPCQAAASGEGRHRPLRGKWIPCGVRPLPGADLCAVHGGPVRPKKIPRWQRLAAEAWDAGYEDGLFDGAQNSSERDRNPYRAETESREHAE